ncbi:MAG TPA: four-carbon acid sugar kinase family protein [Anaerolineae bacterium]|nr:four-carbon acid sugar kinase family protein [Anaerolineae bacterium]HMR63726.1 four-carbon acid sugar kinase family protein [Anaerolineae bacterium]
MSQPLNKSDALASLPPEWPEPLLPQIQTAIKASGRKIVVLDDDPTGTQTVYDLPVLTEWSIESLSAEFADASAAFYILTNSRSLPLNEAQALNRELGHNLVVAAKQVGCDFVVVSRSDSTLRGHFPGEVEALAKALNQSFDGWLLIPYFLEGGRYTINDVHYVAEGDVLIPAAETPFAQDSAFGYRSSNLRAWIEEKTGGRVPAEKVASISLDDIRQGGPERVAQQLASLNNGSTCLVNAVSQRDMDVFVHGSLLAEAQGQQFLYRTAASFVQARLGLAPRPLLTANDLDLPESGGGLIIVGSHVPKTTHQVETLLAQTGVKGIEVAVEALLDETRRAVTIDQAVAQIEQGLRQNHEVMVYTSRRLVTGSDAGASLALGRRVSESLVQIVRSISVRPRYLLAKGGITASDVATQGLGLKRAWVLGQILPGVPVWRAGAESRQPGLAYIVFPGNVGNDAALVEVVTKLRHRLPG